jgi:hypothetical protein
MNLQPSYTQTTSRIGICATPKHRNSTIVSHPILLILGHLRSSNCESFGIAQIPILEVVWVYIDEKITHYKLLTHSFWAKDVIAPFLWQGLYPSGFKNWNFPKVSAPDLNSSKQLLFNWIGLMERSLKMGMLTRGKTNS